MMMITRREIEVLLDSTDKGGYVLSAYIDLTVQNGFERHVEQHIKNQARAAEEALGKTPAGRDLEANLAIVREAIAHQADTKARGLAVFACAARGLRQVVPLDFPVENRLAIDEEPFLLPLLEHWYAEPTFLIALVDADEAHLFEAMHGPPEKVRDVVREDASQDFERDKPHFIYKKRFAQTRHERLRGMADDRFLKEVVQTLREHWSAGNFAGLILLGQAQITGPLRGLLPRELEAAVAGEAPHAMTERAEDLAGTVDRIASAFQADREGRWLAELRDRFTEKHLAAAGPTDVLDALQQGRAGRIFLGNSGDLPGARCLACGYRLGAPVGSCPYCGGTTRAVNAVQEIMRMAMRHNVPVTACRRPADKDDPIAPFGGVAALLVAGPNWTAEPARG